MLNSTFFKLNTYLALLLCCLWSGQSVASTAHETTTHGLSVETPYAEASGTFSLQTIPHFVIGVGRAFEVFVPVANATHIISEAGFQGSKPAWLNAAVTTDGKAVRVWGTPPSSGYGSYTPTVYAKTASGEQASLKLDFRVGNCQHQNWYADADGDGYGAEGSLLQACWQPTGYTSRGGDCNDSDASINPGATEVEGDGKDNNCDGIGEDSSDPILFNVPSEPIRIGINQPFEFSISYKQVNQAGVYAEGISEVPFGLSDPDNMHLYADGAGNWATADHVGSYEMIVWAIDNNGTEYTDTFTLIVEADCKNVGWHTDLDGDGYGRAGEAKQTTCSSWPGMVANNKDCNDNDATINPNSEEVPGDGKDNNCNGQVDEAAAAFALQPVPYFVLGVGRSFEVFIPQDASAHTIAEAGFQGSKPAWLNAAASADGKSVRVWGTPPSNGYGSYTPTVYAKTASGEQATVKLDFRVGNCQHQTWYADKDGDGYGAIGSMLQACWQPEGYISRGGDCDDNDASINPGATEIEGDGKDNNCDGQGGDQPQENQAPVIALSGDLGLKYYEPGKEYTINIEVSDANTDQELRLAFAFDYDQLQEDEYEFTPALPLTGKGSLHTQLRLTPKRSYKTEYIIFIFTATDAAGAETQKRQRIHIDNIPKIYVPEEPFVIGVNQPFMIEVEFEGWGDQMGIYHTQPFGSQSQDELVFFSENESDRPTEAHIGSHEVTFYITDYYAGATITATATVIVSADCQNQKWYKDGDGDGYGKPDSWPNETCSAWEGYVTNNLDCNDKDASISPAAREIPDDGIDNDCDGDVDEPAERPEISFVGIDPEIKGYVVGEEHSFTIRVIDPTPSETFTLQATTLTGEPLDPEVYRFSPSLPASGSDTMLVTLYWTPREESPATSLAIAFHVTDEAGLSHSKELQLDAYVPSKILFPDGHQITVSAGQRFRIPLLGEYDPKSPSGLSHIFLDNHIGGYTSPENWGGLSRVYVGTPSADQVGTYELTVTLRTIYDKVQKTFTLVVEENCATNNWYLDRDGDGYGAGPAAVACSLGSAAFVNNNDDCNDEDASIHPGAEEIEDGKDNNCDGHIDEGRYGLSFKYYHGNWEMLPDFSQLEPLKTGNVGNVSVKPKMREDYYGFVFSGYITLEKSGTYTFYTRSDDGSKLYINGQEVVNNDGLHGLRERSGTIELSAGMHAIEVTHFERTGWYSEGIFISYQGPGISKQLIPDTILTPAEYSPNQAPIVSAGEDEVARAGKYSDVYIVGRASDPDGYIEYFNWTKISGPEVQMDHTEDMRVILRSVTEGTYVMEFTARDNWGVTVRDRMTVTVLASSSSARIASTEEEENPEAVEGLEKLSFYPNPVQDVLTIETGILDAESFEVLVYSLQGSLVYKGQHQADPASGTIELNFQQLDKGIYMLRLQTKEQYRIIKIMKD